MKKALVLALIVAGVTAAAASAVTKGSSSPAVAASRVAVCTSGQIGFMGPLTGPVAFLGREQGTWAKYAIDSFNAANGTHFRVKQGDTQLNPKLALTVGTKFTADKSLLATVGPAGSQEVIAVGKLFARKGLPAISSSATNVVLIDGRYPSFPGRELHDQEAACEEGRDRRRPGGVLDGSRHAGDESLARCRREGSA